MTQGKLSPSVSRTDNALVQRRTQTTTMQHIPLIRMLLLLAASLSLHSNVHVAQAQVGVSICACMPSIYTFQFNFSNLCDQTNVDGPGVLDHECLVDGLQEAQGTTDFVPISISTVQVFELNRDFSVVNSGYYDDGYGDGSSISYASIAGTPEGVATIEENPSLVPSALQLSIIATNAVEEFIVNTWIIVFDNECGYFQVLQDGDQIGWTNLVGLEPPLPAVCSGAETPSPSSVVSTEVPTFVTTTFASTIRPTMVPTSFNLTMPPETPAPTTTEPTTMEPTTMEPTEFNVTAPPKTAPPSSTKATKTSAPTSCIPIIKGVVPSPYIKGSHSYYDTSKTKSSSKRSGKGSGSYRSEKSPKGTKGSNAGTSSSSRIISYLKGSYGNNKDFAYPDDVVDRHTHPRRGLSKDEVTEIKAKGESVVPQESDAEGAQASTMSPGVIPRTNAAPIDDSIIIENPLPIVIEKQYSQSASTKKAIPSSAGSASTGSVASKKSQNHHYGHQPIFCVDEEEPPMPKKSYDSSSSIDSAKQMSKVSYLSKKGYPPKKKYHPSADSKKVPKLTLPPKSSKSSKSLPSSKISKGESNYSSSNKSSGKGSSYASASDKVSSSDDGSTIPVTTGPVSTPVAEPPSQAPEINIPSPAPEIKGVVTPSPDTVTPAPTGGLRNVGGGLAAGARMNRNRGGRTVSQQPGVQPNNVSPSQPKTNAMSRYTARR